MFAQDYMLDYCYKKCSNNATIDGFPVKISKVNERRHSNVF